MGVMFDGLFVVSLAEEFSLDSESSSSIDGQLTEA